jgi:hypothetical protein
MLRDAMAVLAASFALAGCGDEADDQDTMAARAGEVAACVDALVLEVGEHFGPVMREDDLAMIQSLEWQHYRAAGDDLDLLDYWIGEIEVCHDDAGAAPSTQPLIDLEVMSWSELAMHRLIMGVAESPEDAHDEEARYQAAMMDHLGTMRGEHLALAVEAERYLCPAE